MSSNPQVATTPTPGGPGRSWRGRSRTWIAGLFALALAAAVVGLVRPGTVRSGGGGMFNKNVVREVRGELVREPVAMHAVGRDDQHPVYGPLPEEVGGGVDDQLRLAGALLPEHRELCQLARALVVLGLVLERHRLQRMVHVASLADEYHVERSRVCRCGSIDDEELTITVRADDAHFRSPSR